MEARIKIPSGMGLWPAFWALGSNIDHVGWPAAGEIDMMENLASIRR
jgi:beta-glucanase (GH16 family)